MFTKVTKSEKCLTRIYKTTTLSECQNSTSLFQKLANRKILLTGKERHEIPKEEI